MLGLQRMRTPALELADISLLYPQPAKARLQNNTGTAVYIDTFPLTMRSSNNTIHHFALQT